MAAARRRRNPTACLECHRTLLNQEVDYCLECVSLRENRAEARRQVRMRTGLRSRCLDCNEHFELVPGHRPSTRCASCTRARRAATRDRTRTTWALNRLADMAGKSSKKKAKKISAKAKPKKKPAPEKKEGPSTRFDREDVV